MHSGQSEAAADQAAVDAVPGVQAVHGQAPPLAPADVIVPPNAVHAPQVAAAARAVEANPPPFIPVEPIGGGDAAALPVVPVDGGARQPYRYCRQSNLSRYLLRRP